MFRSYLVAACACLFVFVSFALDGAMISSHRMLLSPSEMPAHYSQADISRTAPNFGPTHPRLLVFNGENFEVYNLNHKSRHYKLDDPYPGRSGKTISLLVHALKELNPARFEPGEPVFQLLFLDSDSLSSLCVNAGTCDVEDFAPMLLFGSAPVNATVMPTVKQFPHWFYLSCLYEYKLLGVKKCDWVEPVARGILSWEQLEPTITWRGSDFIFLLHYIEFKFPGAKSIDLTNATSREEVVQILFDNWNKLTPRWRSVALTVKADLHNETWIDSRFVGPHGLEHQKKFMKRGIQVSKAKHMSPTQMGRFKYQIDFGGGGGTSWRGVITKLGLPGLLFHHETRTKDWFFDEMKAWVHYVPVAWHLGDLRTKFEWAESHQEEVKKISEAASRFFDHMMGESYMQKLYHELFVDYLGKIVETYAPSSDSWAVAKTKYEQDGFELCQVAICDTAHCQIPGRSMIPTVPHKSVA